MVEAGKYEIIQPPPPPPPPPRPIYSFVVLHAGGNGSSAPPPATPYEKALAALSSLITKRSRADKSNNGDRFDLLFDYLKVNFLSLLKNTGALFTG